MALIQLPYLETGDPNGVPVICLHGYSDSARSYELMFEHLPRSIHAYSVSLRGHGDADKPRDGYSPVEQAAELAAFMDRVGLESATLVGHSGGSYVAQQFALAHPHRVQGLVLIGAIHDMREALEDMLPVVGALTDPVDAEFVREFQESTITRPIPEGWLDIVLEESAKLPAHVWQEWLTGYVDAVIPVHTGGTITASTLILWGDRDSICSPESQDALLEAIPLSRLVVYEGTGHALHWEQPARSAADIAAFAAQSAAIVTLRPEDLAAVRAS